MKKIILATLIFCGLFVNAQDKTVVQKDKVHPTWLMMGNYLNGSKIKKDELSAFTEFSKSKLAEEYELVSMQATFSAKNKSIIYKNEKATLKFNQELKDILAKLVAGDRMFFDFKLKNIKTGVLITTNTLGYRVI